ncbi:hypothetical protein H4R23_001955 [Coemansia sp. Cherry 401B]|nr:hypothetical protein H4R23_001955 [Coemansia sp. Cherry 401B]
MAASNKQGLRKLKPLKKKTPRLSGGGWNGYAPQAYPMSDGATTSPQVVLFDSDREQLKGGGCCGCCCGFLLGLITCSVCC